MPELLLEILSEEIPARMQARAAADLERLVTAGLKEAGLTFDSSASYVTPRRLTLVVEGLPDKQPDIKDERKGPQVGAPEQAINGFLGSLGGLTLDDCEQREVKGKTFWFAVIDKKGRDTNCVLADTIHSAITNMPWPKSMRWNDYDRKWVRPLHNILAVFDSVTLPLAFHLRGENVYFEPEGFAEAYSESMIEKHGVLTASDATRGHRFMAPDSVAVSDFADYQAKLLVAKVMLDPADRRDKIKADAEKLASEAGLTIKVDDALLDEVAGLVEWPVVLMGRFDDDFLSVPPEVLIAAMRGHQKYFSCLDKGGKLAPHFIVVANMEAPDGGAAITAGNERVLRARLSDAKFFWDQDRKASLSSRMPKLQDIVFHAKIGTLDEKIDRVQSLAVEIAAAVPGADRDLVRSAARLAKADLTTAMVGELPELQGLMGRYYALNDGENEAVADAIADHYSPVGPNDDCPSKPVSVAVALADKIDTLVAFWAIDEKPTGSKDPFALRRAALGVIRLITENNLRLSLLDVFASAGGKDVATDLLAFFADRLKVHLKEQGVRHDLIDAVFALGEDDLVRMLARVDALGLFVVSDDGANLLTANKRAANILKIEEKKDGRAFDGAVSEGVLAEDAEKALFQALEVTEKSCQAALQNEDFAAAMAALAGLRGPVDGFFDKVTVNSEDPDQRENRLKLLNRIRTVMQTVADFSKIEG